MSDELGKRMKRYEKSLDVKITPHVPTILRVDGKSFHNYTKKFDKPYDRKLIHSMQYASQNCSRILHYDISYGQSDEVSFLFYRPDTRSQEEFDGRLFKLSSIMASAFTYYFNTVINYDIPALFDCRVFQLPKNEVVNYFIWRQKDAIRNSIQMLGQYHFSQKQLHKKTCNQIQEMLFSTKGINWNNIETELKRGWCTDRVFVYHNIPEFTQDRNYIEKYLLNEEE